MQFFNENIGNLIPQCPIKIRDIRLCYIILLILLLSVRYQEKEMPRCGNESAEIMPHRRKWFAKQNISVGRNIFAKDQADRVMFLSCAIVLVCITK